jgi:hypothetical protein
MVFNIEVSFNILKHNSVIEIEQIIINLAGKYNCHSYYSITEMENNFYKNRNHIIFVISFDIIDIKLLEGFIKEIKKMRNVYIESLYEDDIICKLIYASQSYLSTIDKDKVLLYNKRKRAYSEDEITLFNGITGKA